MHSPNSNREMALTPARIYGRASLEFETEPVLVQRLDRFESQDQPQDTQRSGRPDSAGAGVTRPSLINCSKATCCSALASRVDIPNS